MTKAEFLAGKGETPAERNKRKAREEWANYSVSDEGVDEIITLMDMDVYDGPTGDA